MSDPSGVTLEDKYRLRAGRVYLTGTQALVRLPIEQRLRDEAAGHRTGGYVSGYRGSPLGRYDMELQAAGEQLAALNVHVRPAVNEDLAATALWGTQYVGTFPGAQVDGVFGIWYGKGPGVDRSGDVLRHANSAGTSALGGVLALAGDDHGAKSSTIANFSDQILVATGIPLLYPSNTQELLDFGLHGLAMSRYSGCWVGMKVVTDVVEGGGTIEVGPERALVRLPPSPAPASPAPAAPGPAASGPAAPRPAGYHIRAVDLPLLQEARLYHEKLPAVLAYARANDLNSVTFDSQPARIGVLAAGKAWQDLLQALGELGWSESTRHELGLRLGKVGLLWPLDPVFVRDFAAGLDMILVVEEKRPLLEQQLKSLLYDLAPAQRPRIIGKFSGASEYLPERGERVFPSAAELSPPLIAQALLGVVRAAAPHCAIGVGASPATRGAAASAAPAVPLRLPSFCSGCPHNRSTRVPEGSRALAGIGCHTIAMLHDPFTTTTVSQMGGEGVMWLGQQPFTAERHVFANMGDGTYFHSGFLAIRQAVAARVPITFKLLVNGFVAMTGGQPIDGDLPIDRIVGELIAEGVPRIVVVTDEPERLTRITLPRNVPVHPRTELERVQRELREFPGVSVLLYDQPCATERRRLRKRGKWADPDRRTFINAAVCEGCGDCGKSSNCLSVEPLETPFGRKRRINQSSCNKDFSCVEGFCPSFVTVHGGRLRRPAASAASVAPAATLPPPAISRPTGAFSILVTGIGGTGVVTIGQLLGMAAHLDGLHSSVLDVTGLAQKYGAVLSHVRIAPEAGALHATRIAAGEADTVIGCDLLVTAGDEVLSRFRAGSTHLAVSTDATATAEFARNPDWNPDLNRLLTRVRAVAAPDCLALESVRLATALLGDAIAANLFLLGAAWQRGWVPVSHAALQRAIELNGVQVEFNRRCFLLGREAAIAPQAVESRARVAAAAPPETGAGDSLGQMVERRAEYLVGYQNAALAARYRAWVERARSAEASLGAGDALARAVASGYFKLLARKDEWEVARLYTAPEFRRELEAAFEGDYRLHFHLAAWPFGGRDPRTGAASKREFGPWMLTALRVLSSMRGLRDSWLDPFRHTPERALHRQLLEQYESDLERVLPSLTAAGYQAAVRLASLPERIRGFGHVRELAARSVASERSSLLATLAGAGTGAGTGAAAGTATG